MVPRTFCPHGLLFRPDAMDLRRDSRGGDGMRLPPPPVSNLASSFHLPNEDLSALRAWYNRDRTVESVVCKITAISTVDSSFTAESRKTSRSLACNASM